MQYRNVKELQKLKSIQNILIPSLVRRSAEAQALGTKKAAGGSQGEVTLIFVQLEDFEDILAGYQGKDLVWLLDKVYNAFDALCEQHGIQKIETVGKTFIACGGLKICEREVDTRLLGSHHSVRVTDFALRVQGYAATMPLRNGQKLRVKIGIHMGEVIGGVIGEIKPQFTLLGNTVLKAEAICEHSRGQKIYISEDAHKALETYSNNFAFTQISHKVPGFEAELVYMVGKRKARGKLALRQKVGLFRRQGQAMADPKRPEHGGSRDRKLLSSFSGIVGDYGGEGSNQYPGPSVTPESYAMGAESARSSVQQQSEHERSVSASLETGRNSLNDSLEDNRIGSNNKLIDIKDDKHIVNSAAQNERYNLVERPRFLFTFELKEQESVFFLHLLNQNYNLETFQQVAKVLLDFVVIAGLLYTYFGFNIQSAWGYAGVILALVAIEATLLYHMSRLRSTQFTCWLLIQVTGVAISMVFFVWNGPKFQNFLLRESQQVTIAIFQTIIVMSSAWPFRVFACLQAFLCIILCVQNYYFISAHVLHFLTFLIDSWINVLFITFLILASHTREMAVRKRYNLERIYAVELDKTEELLGKLVPLHVLNGIKNDQKIYDQLESVTILYAEMVGFNEIITQSGTDRHMAPNLLSRIFSKFD